MMHDDIQRLADKHTSTRLIAHRVHIILYLVMRPMEKMVLDCLIFLSKIYMIV